jgi:hypothetical protein
MTNAFGLPDWVPWWVQLLALILGILIALAFMLMPFSVFGVKSRLDVIEARLDEIQDDIRVLALRLQDTPRPPAFQEDPARAAAMAQPAQVRPRPPAPVAPWTAEGAVRRPIGGATPPARQDPSLARPRAEPRLDRLR